MNVYSLRLIPSLKLKLCEYLGIASTMAISELENRVGRLEVVLNRLDQRSRRPLRPRMLIQDTPIKAPKAKKKPVVRNAATKKPVVQAQVEAPVETPELSPVMLEATPSPSPVLLIQADAETRQAILDYFGPEVPYVMVETWEQGLEQLSGRVPQAVFFDRLLLAQEEARQAIQTFAAQNPTTRLVGLSSYLTLAFSQSMPAGVGEFATFLTKPLQKQGLDELFEGAAQAAG